MTTDPPRIHPQARASLQFLCPRCEEMFLYPFDRSLPASGPLECPHCHLVFDRTASPPRATEPLDRCWLCGGKDFYVQKDFNRDLGFMIILASGVVIFLVMLLIDHRLGILCLLGIALLDWIIYRMLANVTVCYLCQSIYRGFPLHPEHRGFYLGLEEKYKKRRREWLDEALGEER